MIGRINKGIGALIAAGLIAAACTGGAAPSQTPAGSTGTAEPSGSVAGACGTAVPTGVVYSMAICQIDAPSLAGNLLGDEPIVNAVILTPVDYDSGNVRYPSVYVLAGFQDPAGGIAYGFGAATAPADGKTAPIVVVVSGVNSLGGGFYVNSSVTGNWEDAITKDVVGYVDSHYRTLAKPESRGIAGHSMGGYGAISIAMHHPELFSALYSEAPGLFDKDGGVARLGDSGVIDQALEFQETLNGKSGKDAVEAIVAAAGGGGSDFGFELAYGLAFAPATDSPMLTHFPFFKKAGTVGRDETLWAQWEAGFGNLPAKLTQYGSALKRYKGIALDWGTNDGYEWIRNGCAYFADLLRDAGIEATVTTHDGDHISRVNDRLTNQMLPFMEGLLATA